MGAIVSSLYVSLIYGINRDPITPTPMFINNITMNKIANVDQLKCIITRFNS